MLSDNVPYKDLGAAYLDQRDQTRVVRTLERRLEQLGYLVMLTKVEPPQTEVANMN